MIALQLRRLVAIIFSRFGAEVAKLQTAASDAPTAGVIISNRQVLFRRFRPACA